MSPALVSILDFLRFGSRSAWAQPPRKNLNNSVLQMQPYANRIEHSQVSECGLDNQGDPVVTLHTGHSVLLTDLCGMACTDRNVRTNLARTESLGLCVIVAQMRNSHVAE
ncbi:hypothetical protein BDW42DRAFT_114141 [Aspergillus taichungensis]|uniref:Uncharacterized protein n=1 Tax=Aspergillus taichungensis TaxID=482145 RepID=A0A2J5HSW5_9EURO|nr:hypothetical protein BDW42DRAFT_114141 [Aspergillus taichungensis]